MRDLEHIFEFEDVESCMLCGSTEKHDGRGISWRGYGFSYSYCKRCGLKFMNPRPTNASYERFFKEVYWQYNMSGRGFRTVDGFDNENLDQLELRMPKYQNVYRQLRGDLEGAIELVPGKRAVEVGCAFGFSMEWLRRDYGCSTFGIEPSHESRKRCEAGGVPLLAYTGEEFFIGATDVPREKQFDFIYFSQALECVPRPREMMLGVREYLAPDGLLLIRTPNVEYYDAMAPFTPFLYSPETLTRLLKVCGFEVTRITTTPSPVDKATAVRMTRPRYNFAAYARRGELGAVEHPTVDVYELLRVHDLGRKSFDWSELSFGELALRLALKVKDKTGDALKRFSTLRGHT